MANGKKRRRPKSTEIRGSRKVLFPGKKNREK